jgi:chromosome segregation ATPase
LDDRIETTVSPREVNIETEYELRKELAGRQGSIDGLNQIVAIRKKDDIRHKRRVKELETRIKDLQWNLAQQTELTSAFQKSIDTYRERAAEHRLKNVVRDQEINELESELDDARRNQCVCSDPTGAQQLDLLDDILKIANTTIHQKMRSPYHKNDAFDGDRMREVCDVVTDFRRRHNIVG